MTPVKIKWEVAPVSVGRHRSFDKRDWPMGRVNGTNRVLIRCDSEYIPAHVKTGDHAPIDVLVDIFHDGKARLQRLRGTSATLADAKARALEFFQAHPDCIAPATEGETP